MGEARRRKQQLGDLYGTPEGSNQAGRICSGISKDGRLMLRIQDVATADGRPWCICEPDGSDGPVCVTSNPPAELGGSGIWVPPLKPGVPFRYRHPISVRRSLLSGKWAVEIETACGRGTLDVFHDLETALRSAQNSQAVFGEVTAVEADGPMRHFLLMESIRWDKADGIESDDEFLAKMVDSGDGLFRTLQATGSVSTERLAPIIDDFRAAGIRVRMPDPVEPAA